MYRFKLVSPLQGSVKLFPRAINFLIQFVNTVVTQGPTVNRNTRTCEIIQQKRKG